MTTAISIESQLRFDGREFERDQDNGSINGDRLRAVLRGERKWKVFGLTGYRDD